MRQETAEGLSRLTVKGTDDCDINDDISVMAVAIRAYSQLREATDTAPDKTLIMAKVPNLPTIDEFFCAQSTEAYCDKIWLARRMPGF